MDNELIKEQLMQIWIELGKTQWIQSIGNSMRPLIVEGSSLALEFCKPDKIRLGHIIAFRNKKDTVVHRVIGFWNRAEKVYFVEKGDNNPYFTLIEQSALLGRVISMKTGNKTINLKSPLWRCLDFLFVIYGWIFTGLFWSLYSIKVLLFGREKKAWTQWTYKFLMEFFLFIPRNIVRLLKRVKK